MFACFSPQSRPLTYCNWTNIHTSCRTASTLPFQSIPDISYGTNPHFQLSSTFPRNNLGNVWCRAWARLEFGRLYEGVSLDPADVLQPIYAWIWISRVSWWLMIDVWIWFVVSWDMVCSWSGLNATNGDIFLYSMMDLYKNMADDGDVVFLLFSGTC